MVSPASDMDYDLDLVNSGNVVDCFKLRCRFEEWVFDKISKLDSTLIFSPFPASFDSMDLQLLELQFEVQLCHSIGRYQGCLAIT
jgi:hypothetical protein